LYIFSLDETYIGQHVIIRYNNNLVL